MPEIQLDTKADDQKLLAQVVGYYHRTLKQSPEALDFLRKKGLTNGQAIEQFHIGYANRTLGLTIPGKRIKSGKEMRARLEALNIFRPGTGHENFNGCVVFPVQSIHGTGEIVDIYGCKIQGTRLRKGTLLDVFMAPERRGVWNITAFSATDEIILCPSMFDALAFWNAGYRNVTCTFGPDSITDDHLSAFDKFGIHRVLTTCENATHRLLEAGVGCSCIRLPSGINTSEYAQQSDDPASALGGIIGAAERCGPVNSVAVPSIPVKSDDDEINSGERPPVETPCGEPNGLDAEPKESPDAPDVPRADGAETDTERDEVRITFGNRRYRIRGLYRNLSFDLLRVNVLATNGRGTHVDTFDLYSSRHRQSFIAQVAAELEVEERAVKKDLGRLLLTLEDLQDQQIRAALEPKPVTPPMTPGEKEAALDLLCDPKDPGLNNFSDSGRANNDFGPYRKGEGRCARSGIRWRPNGG